LKGR
jgi:hypothetical protein